MFFCVLHNAMIFVWKLILLQYIDTGIKYDLAMVFVRFIYLRLILHPQYDDISKWSSVICLVQYNTYSANVSMYKCAVLFVNVIQ